MSHAVDGRYGSANEDVPRSLGLVMRMADHGVIGEVGNPHPHLPAVAQHGCGCTQIVRHIPYVIVHDENPLQLTMRASSRPRFRFVLRALFRFSHIAGNSPQQTRNQQRLEVSRNHRCVLIFDELGKSWRRDVPVHAPPGALLGCLSKRD